MLARFYIYLKNRIEIIESQLTSNFANHCTGTSSSIFYIRVIELNLSLISLEILSDTVKFFIILFADSGHGFDILFKQRETKSCPYSYHNFKTVQRKIRVFSSAGLTTIIASVVIVSLVMNLILTPFLPAYAVTFGWNQSDWGPTASSTAYASHNGSPAQGWMHYSSSTPATIEASSSLALKSATGPSASTTQTSDTDFGAGQFAASEILADGSGQDASIIGCMYNHNGANWEPLDNSADPVTGAVYDLNAGAGIEIAGTHCNIGNFTIASGKTVYVKAYDGTNYGSVRIFASSSTITGTLDASGKGYAGVVGGANGNGPGAGSQNGGRATSGMYGGKSGAAYGGYVGSNSNVYGAYSYPVHMGSSGGIIPGYGATMSGAGGGHIKISTANALILNGNLLANGLSVGVANIGAGSGGSIWLIGNTFSGNGTASVVGGNSEFGGGAGGGRIGIEFLAKTFTGGLLANGGVTNQPSASKGGAGTIYQKATSQLYGELIVDNNNVNGVVTPLFIATQNGYFTKLTITKYAKVINANDIIVSDLVVDNNGSLVANGSVTALASLNGQVGPNYSLNSGTITAGASGFNFPGFINNLTLNNFTLQTSLINILESLTIGSGAVITHAPGDTAGLIINAQNVDIQTGGMIDVSSKGYMGVTTLSNGNGPGAGTQNGNRSVSGIYGGKNGAAYGGYIGSSNIYGSFERPNQLGSSGGNYDGGWLSGAGGGYVKINATNTLNINGSILSDGGATSGNVGAGSGGSIWLSANSLTGSGTTSASGGFTDFAGGSSGGRIAIEYVNSSFSGGLIAKAGAYSLYNTQGGAGTIYLKSASQQYGELIINNENVNGANTPASTTPVNLMLDNLTVTKYGKLTNVINATTTNLTVTTNGSITASGKIYYKASTTDGTGTITAPGGIIQYALAKIQYLAIKTFNQAKKLLFSFVLIPGAQAATFTYTSGNIDTGMETAYKTITFTTLKATSSFVTYQLATSDSDQGPWTYVGPAGTTAGGDVYTSATTSQTITNLSGKRYLKYKAYFDNAQDSNLDSITFNYTTTIYAPSGYLISSWYNTSDESNLLGQILWRETSLPAGTNIRLQIRTAKNDSNGNVPDAVNRTAFMGPSGNASSSFSLNNQGNYCIVDGQPGPCCTKPQGSDIVTCTIPDSIAISDKTNDQWMQYEVWLESGNSYTPVADDIELKYVVNTKPEARLVDLNVTQSTDGTVRIDYQAIDRDTYVEGAAWPGHTQAFLEYYNPVTGLWNLATVGSTTVDIPNPADWSNASTFTWLPRYEPNFINATSSIINGVKVRIRVDDHEGGNNIGYSPESSVFSLETKKTAINLLNANVAQELDGTVIVPYEVNDPDSSVAGVAWNNQMEIALEYFDPQDSQWHLSSATTSIFNIVQGQWSSSTFSWDPRIDLSGRYIPNLQVRLRADDHEPDNPLYDNYGYSSSTVAFALDAKPPVINQVNINASTQVGAQGAAINQNVTDDNLENMQMRISCAVRSEAGGTILDETNACTRDWEPYATTTAVFLDNSAKAYAIFKDKFGNETIINNIYAPPAPDGLMLGDISNPATEPPTYQLYISWKKVDDVDANFARYVIWRSTSPKENTYTTDAGYEQLTFDRYLEIASSSENYIMERNLDTAVTYYYKVTMEDTNGNVSRYLSIVQDNPDGQGGTDQTKPDIYFPKVSATTTQTATIVWSTNEPAKSMVQYLTREQYDLNIANNEVDPFNSALRVGVNSLSKNENELGLHKIELIGLESNTEYYYKVISEDPAGNIAEISEFNSEQLKFTTKLGPKITPNSVNQRDIKNTSINITWTTNIPADSTVVYSTTTDGNNQLTTPLEIKGSQETVTDHVVGLFGLIPNTTYYYYVKSGVQNIETNEFVEAVDKNIISTYAEDQVTIIGQETRYYTFKTTYDSQAPIISDPTCEPSVTSTSSIQGLIISATTTEPSVVSLRYGTDENNLNTELATTTNYNADQIITVDNLISSTTYYFQFSVADEAGNTAASNVFSCKTMVEMMAKEEVEKQLALMVTKEEAQQQAEAAKQAGIGQGQASAPGGGMIIIDKTDKVAPILSNIEVTAVTATSARVSWVTNEPANGFIKFGRDSNYGDYAGFDDLFINHFFVLKNLEPKIVYHYRISSADASGNLVKSDNLTFQTSALSVEEALALSTSTVPGTKEDKETLMKSIAEKAIAIISSLANQVSLGSLENTLLSQYDALEKLAQIIPAPVLSGEPNVDTTPTTAVIKWATDKKANSLVAYTPETLFVKSKNDSAYIQVVGQSKEDVTSHNVKIYNLKPETVYHFQLRSQGNVGPDAKSRDFTFKTKPDALEIVSHNSEILSPEKAQFNWLTSLEADTQITYTPYRAGKLSLDELKTISNKALSVNHEMVLNELESGAVYQVELTSTDKKGIKVSNVINFFSTTKDDLPPTIDNIQTESALSQGKDLKVQTAISWTTNEPTACSLKYAKGSTQVETDLTEETMPEASYSRKHALVITKFELGSVYSFRIYCTDSGDNQTISEPHAILTPKQRDSVFDLIINTMEQTFGWIGKLKG